MGKAFARGASERADPVDAGTLGGPLIGSALSTFLPRSPLRSRRGAPRCVGELGEPQGYTVVGP